MIRCVPVAHSGTGFARGGPVKPGRAFRLSPPFDIHHCHAPALFRGLGSGGRAHPFREETL
jgi:hypothetical protein